MVVDDTITYRMITKKVAESIPGVEVLSTASNGKLAFDKLVAAKQAELPDVVLLDVEMPVMDGITTLKKIKKRFPSVAVVMISALSRSNANIIVECLNAGALDFVTKPLETHAEEAKKALRSDLQPILALIVQNTQQGAGGGQGVRGAAAAVRSKPTATVVPASRRFKTKPALSQQPVVVPATSRSSPSRPVVSPVATAPRVAALGAGVGVAKAATVVQNFKPSLVLIGSSTGGPAALTKVLTALGKGKTISTPILIVQHMPPIFTASLAMQLSRASGLKVREAEDSMEIVPGSVILARGGQHMTVRRQENKLMACMTDGPKVNECRPAVDVLFMSVMAEFSGQILSIIMTGMGRDGTNGVDALKRVGKTYCITQEKDSCVVYGMPRSVEEKGLSDESLPLELIGPKIAEVCVS